MKNEQKLVLLRKYIQLFNKESNLAIYLLLGLHGQMTPNELIENTKFGKATIFRSLKDLSEAGLVDADIDISIKDKRKNKFYFVIKELDDFPNTDDDFIAFCVKNSHTETLKDFIVFIRSLAVNSMKVSMDFRANVQERNSTEDWYSKVANKGLFAFSILDLKENEKIMTFAKEFLEKVQALPDRKKEPSREPMKNPLVLSLGVFPLKITTKDNQSTSE